MKEHELTGMVRTRLRSQASGLEKTIQNARKRHAARVLRILEALPEVVIKELRATGDIPGSSDVAKPEPEVAQEEQSDDGF